jgi:hypothetical protein
MAETRLRALGGAPPPPRRMPLRHAGRWRKAWRYIGVYDEAFMLCAATVSVGPGSETFWALWDRRERRMLERTRRVLPALRPDVVLAGDDVAVRSGDVAIELELELDRVEAIESLNPVDDGGREGGFTWTRKRAGFPVGGTIRVAGREHRLVGARGVDDVTAGFHARRTSWHWSAGVGEAADGRALAWNLVTGINDPATGSERAVWVDGVPSEPAPVSFEGLDAIRFEDGSRLRFAAEGTRAHRESVPLLMSSDYEAPFGAFEGSLGGIELKCGLGVMERHDAVW